jgi:hypothetical protein
MCVDKVALEATIGVLIPHHGQLSGVCRLKLVSFFPWSFYLFKETRERERERTTEAEICVFL